MRRRTAAKFGGLALGVCAILGAAAPPKKDRADLLVVNARVLTMDEKFSVYDPGGLAVAGGKIVAVGPSDELARRFAAKSRFDARGEIVMPGLVNTHTHAAMSLLRGIADDLPLDRWLTEHIFPAEARNVSPEFVYDGTLEAALEMIEGGTTAFADMYYYESDAARAVDKAGLRGVLGETFLDFPVPDHKDLPATLAYTKTFVAKWKGHHRIVPAVAPHAPYTCSRETLLAARDLALAEGVPLLIHVAETKKELEDARKNWQQTPFLRLASVGFFDSGAGRPPCPHPCGARGVDRRQGPRDHPPLRRGVVAQSRVQHEARLGHRRRLGVAEGWNRVGTGHRRGGRIQQRSVDVRGHGLRRKAGQGLEGRSHGPSGQGSGRRGHAREGLAPWGSRTGSGRSSRASAPT